jgi:galactokinase
MSRVIAPGRVNLIGDHTDYVGGLALPCAIDLAITAEFERGGDEVVLTSDATAEPASFAVGDDDVAEQASVWERLVHAAARLVAPTTGVRGRLTTTLPIGAGLSSSAACSIALALALGFEGEQRDLVLLAQAVEQQATGVACGVLDQLAIVYGQAGHACLIDAAAVTATPIALPSATVVVVVPSGHARALNETPYAERRSQAEAAINELGGLESASHADVDALRDPMLRKRARHVITENERVRAMVDALTASDGRAAGALMRASHESLRHDAEVSTHDLDSLVDALSTRTGVFGARLTGAGFGGSVVALVERPHAASIAETFGGRIVTPSNGARVL